MDTGVILLTIKKLVQHCLVDRDFFSTGVYIYTHHDTAIRTLKNIITASY